MVVLVAGGGGRLPEWPTTADSDDRRTAAIGMGVTGDVSRTEEGWEKNRAATAVGAGPERSRWRQ